jgi:hypothetical protein
MGRDGRDFELAACRRVANLSGDSEVLLFPASPCNVFVGGEAAIVDDGTGLVQTS